MSHVPSPADAARPTAEEFLDSIAAQGARIFRYMEPPRVFILTQNPQLVRDLERLGARQYKPGHYTPAEDAPMGGYQRVPGGPWEWDMEIGALPFEGLWEAAGAYRRSHP